NDRSLLIPPMIVDRLFSKLNGRAISFEEYTDVRFEIDPKENQLPLTFRLEKGSGEEFKLDVSDLKTIVF
ncbi:SNF2 helicase associated domain-containing protein, partial [Cohnella sp. REN36]